MKLWVIFFCMLCAAPALAQSDEAQIGGATVPVMHNDGSAVIAPVKPIAPVQTPAEIAADQALRKQADSDVGNFSERVSDACDSSFKTRIDWTTITPLQTHRYNPADACGTALQALEQLCANPAAKARVQDEVKSIICTTGAQPSIEMHAGTLVYTIDWQSADPGTRVYAWLASHL